jgi:hypothetical protein
VVFCFVDRFFVGVDQFDLVFLQNIMSGEIQRTVQRDLTTHNRQQRIRTLFLDDFFHHLPNNQLDINNIHHFRIDHDNDRI